MRPLSTRTALANERGLAAGIAEMATLAPSGLVLEARPGRAGDLVAAERAALRAGCEVLAVVAPLAVEPPRGGALPSADAADPELRAEWVRAVTTEIPRLARLDASRLVVTVSERALGPATPDESDSAPRAALSAFRAQHLRAREKRTEELCRALDAVARVERQVEILVLPGEAVRGSLDLETAGWVAEALGGRNVGFALDTGILGLRHALGDEPPEAWFEALGARLRLVLLSDHDGRQRADLLPGLGRGDGLLASRAASRSVPRVLRPDPTVPLAFVAEADRMLSERGL